MNKNSVAPQSPSDNNRLIDLAQSVINMNQLNQSKTLNYKNEEVKELKSKNEGQEKELNTYKQNDDTACTANGNVSAPGHNLSFGFNFKKGCFRSLCSNNDKQKETIKLKDEPPVEKEVKEKKK